MDIVLYCETSGEKRLACAQAGCEDCLRALLRENEGLIWAVARAQRIGRAERADLWQVGEIGFWIAVRHYDPQRGVRFSTYAWVVMRHMIWHLVKNASKSAGWLEGAPAQDRVEALIAAWQAEQIHQALGEALEQLSERQRQIVEWHYGWEGQAPQMLSEIGQTLGISGERVRQIRNDALTLLRAPALSIRLRSICERSSGENYRQALRQNRRWLSKSRRRR